MKTLIEEDMKSQQFKHAYLLYGEEAYLVRLYRDRLKHALVAEGDTMNVAFFEGKNIDPGALIDLAETMPFFAERRCIFVDRSGFFKKSADELADYMDKIPETSFFVFTESEVDRRGRLYKQVKKYGRAVEFPRQKEDVLRDWILVNMKREGKKIRRSVFEDFLTRTGNDMELISQELEKLFCYTLGREVIEAADVDAVCAHQISDRIFDMVDAIARKQQKQALDLYYDLLILKERPHRILSLIARQFYILLQLKELMVQRVGKDYMAKKVDVPGFAVDKYIGQARKFTKEQLLLAVEDGVQAAENIRTGRIEDQIAVELLIMEYSSV